MIVNSSNNNLDNYFTVNFINASKIQIYQLYIENFMHIIYSCFSNQVRSLFSSLHSDKIRKLFVNNLFFWCRQIEWRIIRLTEVLLNYLRIFFALL